MSGAPAAYLICFSAGSRCACLAQIGLQSICSAALRLLIVAVSANLATTSLADSAGSTGVNNYDRVL